MAAPKLIGVAVLLVVCIPATAEQLGHTPLPTKEIARQIHALQGPKEAIPVDSPGLRVWVANIRSKVGNFVIRQIQAYPSISECDLQKQLALAFAIGYNTCGIRQERGDASTRVFAEPWGPNSTHRVFVVTYLWFGFYGNGGSETGLENYVWDRDAGVRRGAGIVPASFSGYITQTEELCWFPGPDKYPERYWVLVSGMVGGGSGQVIGGSAAIFEISPNGGSVVWSAPPGIGNVEVYAIPRSLRWEIEYTDAKRFYERLPNARMLDIFQIDFTNQTYRRLVHQPLD